MWGNEESRSVWCTLCRTFKTWDDTWEMMIYESNLTVPISRLEESFEWSQYAMMSDLLYLSGALGK